MNEAKHRIQRAFNEAVTTYDQHCQLQNQINDLLIEHLKHYIHQASCMVDLGCGTGNSTQALSKHFAYDILYGVDIAGQLVQSAQKKCLRHSIYYGISDFDKPHFQSCSIHLFYSNMALQWSQNIQATFQLLYHQLKSNGVLALSLPVEGTFEELPREKRNHFYAIDEIKTFLNQAGFSLQDVFRKDYCLSFSSYKALLISIKRMGAHCLLKPYRQKSTPVAVISQPVYQLTYHIGYFIAKK